MISSTPGTALRARLSGCIPFAAALALAVSLPAFACDGGTWSKIAPTGPTPGRIESSAAYDAAHGRWILFGGAGYLGDTWSFDLVGNAGWTNLAPANAPSPRRAASMVFDPVRNRIILFGGDDGTYHNDVWALNLNGVPNWTPIAPVGTPPIGRMWAVGIYDPGRDRILYFGGYNNGQLFGDVWELRLSGGETWNQVVTNSGPSPRWGTIGAYDPDEDRLIIATGLASDGYKNDVWALPLSGAPLWSLVSTTGIGPTPTFLATGVYDAPRHRLLIHGGYPDLNNKVWELRLDGAPGWSLLTPDGLTAPARRAHVAVYDPTGNRMVTIGGFDTPNETWALTFAPVAPAPPTVFAFAPAGGPVGTSVTILGNNFDGATSLTFNGVEAPILSANYSLIATQVPAGATTGKVSVTTPLGTGTSTADFVVDYTPIILSATPDSGKARAKISIRGAHFTAANRVSFGGIGSASFTVVSDSSIVAIVDTLAVTGHIFVTTPPGTGESAFDFEVLPLTPYPRIVAVRDVARDQGGHVVVSWEASDFDLPSKKTITGYRVWRRAPALTSEARSRLVPAARLFAARPDRPLVDEFWESVAQLPAAFLDGYSYTAATPFDSTSDGNEYTAFFVQALTADPFTFYSSAVDSGYSVDNLSPPQPAPFIADYRTYEVSLRWGGSRAADFREFHLHSGTSATFPIDAANLVTSTRDTSYVDASPGASARYYKLVAVDLHGNASRVALVSPDTPVAALASLVSVEPSERAVRLTWYSGGNPGMLVHVERREETTDWTSIADVIADGSGFIRFEDDDVIAGTRYGWRLAIDDGEAQVFTEPVWETAATPSFALTGPWPNPSRHGRFSVAFVLPTAERGTLELWDVAGRRVDRREIGGTSRQIVSFGDRARLAPGLYLLRMTQGERRTSRRVIVLD